MISPAFTPPAGPADPASNVAMRREQSQSPHVVATPVAGSDLTGVTTVVTGASTGVSYRQLEPDHLSVRTGELRPRCLRGDDHPLGRLTGCAPESCAAV